MFATRLKWLKLLAAIWTGAFVLVWLPFAAVYKHNIDARTVVTASATGHRVTPRKGPRSRGELVVAATVTFKRLQGERWIDCRLEGFVLGRVGDAHSQRRTLTLAPHPLSCSDPVEVPWPHYWTFQFAAYAVILLLLSITVLGAGGPGRAFIWKRKSARTAPQAG